MRSIGGLKSFAAVRTIRNVMTTESSAPTHQDRDRTPATTVAEIHARMVGGTRVWNSPRCARDIPRTHMLSSRIAEEMRQSGWHPRCDASGMRNSPRQRVRRGMTVWLCVAAAAALHGQSST